MSTTLAAQSYATALNRNTLYATYALHHVIPKKVLRPDEKVLLVLPGVASDFPKVLVATVDRLFVARVGGVIRRHSILRQVPAGDVVGVDYGGRLFDRIRVHVRGARDIAMLPNTSEETRRFEEALRHLVATRRLPDGMGG